MSNLHLTIAAVISVAFSIGNAQQLGVSPLVLAAGQPAFTAARQPIYLQSQLQQSPNLMFAMRYQRPMSSPMMMSGPSATQAYPMSANMMMGGAGGYPVAYNSYPMGAQSAFSGYPVRSLSLHSPIQTPEMAINQGYPYGPRTPAEAIAESYGTPMDSQFGSPLGGAYPDDPRIITANGLGVGGGFRGDMSGVSFFPFARIRPGPGLVIIQKEEDEAVSNSTTAADNSTALETTTATFPLLQEASTATFPLITAPITATKLAATMPPVTTTANSTNTTPPACVHPIYMNRVFMSTALSMGLISKNTSCVVLVDQ